MPSERLPPSVERLLRERIMSFEELEILLLLRARRDRGFTAAAAAAEVARTVEETALALEQLCAAQLVDTDTDPVSGGATFRYRPGSPELEQSVDALVRVKQRQSPALVRQLAANAIRRIRGAAHDLAAAIIQRRQPR